jgi:exodeoxyribonuclease VII large subunit
VIRDILHIFDRRFRGLHVRIFPVLVQGEGSVEQVCAGLRYFSEHWADLVILARGGGSLEDLWTFNEEAVARATAASRTPVISAIGHETDFTISDFVADLRAPTPSAAAELAICTSESLLEQVAVLRNKALQGVRYRLLVSSRDLHARGIERAARLIHRQLAGLAQRLDDSDENLDRHRRSFFDQRRTRLADLQKRLDSANLQLRLSRIRHRIDLGTRQLMQELQKHLQTHRHRYSSLTLHLRQLSPLAVLERGYAVVHRQDGAIVRQAASVAAGELLRIRLGQGELEAIAQEQDGER